MAGDDVAAVAVAAGVVVRVGQFMDSASPAASQERQECTTRGSPNLWYKITDPDGKEMWPIAPEGWKGRWVLKYDEWKRRQKEDLTQWKKQKGKWVPYYLEIGSNGPDAPPRGGSHASDHRQAP